MQHTIKSQKHFLSKPFTKIEAHPKNKICLQKYLLKCYSASFLMNPSIRQVITEPTSHARIYISGLPTVANTKIPPCGAISVHLNKAERKPATPAPTHVQGIT